MGATPEHICPGADRPFKVQVYGLNMRRMMDLADNCQGVIRVSAAHCRKTMTTAPKTECAFAN